MPKTKLHAIHRGVPMNGVYSFTTKCWKSVAKSQIAAFDSGVTCKTCLKAIAWEKEHNACHSAEQKAKGEK